MSELPDGWRSVPLTDTGTWLSGGTPLTEEPRYWHGDIPWISAASLKNFHIRNSQRSVTPLGASAGSRVVPPGTVLFVVRGMSLKNEFRVGVTQRRVAFGQDCKAIIPAPGIDPTFLALAIQARASEILGMVDEAGHGTGRLPIDLISQLKISIPEPAEQRRIADSLGALDGQVSVSTRVVEKLEAVVSALIEERLAEISENAPVIRLSDVANASGGITLGAEPAGYGSIELPYLRVANVQDGYIDTAEMKTVRILQAELSRYLLRKGDVLLTEGGDLDKLGRGAVWDGRIFPCLCQNHVFRVRCDESRILPEYLSAYASSLMGKAYFLKMAKQTTNLATINSTQLKAMPLPVPPMPDQISLASLASSCGRRLGAEQERLVKLRELRQGLMDDLLSGRVRAAGAGLSDTGRVT